MKDTRLRRMPQETKEDWTLREEKVHQQPAAKFLSESSPNLNKGEGGGGGKRTHPLTVRIGTGTGGNRKGNLGLTRGLATSAP